MMMRLVYTVAFLAMFMGTRFYVGVVEAHDVALVFIAVALIVLRFESVLLNGGRLDLQGELDVYPKERCCTTAGPRVESCCTTTGPREAQ